jgi:hypothetical protein
MNGFGLLKGGVIALILIIVFFVVQAKIPGVANAGLETIDENAEELGINILSFPEIQSITTSVQSDGSIVVEWKLNRDAQELMDEDGSDYQIEFLYKKYLGSVAGDAITDVCTTWLKTIRKKKIVRDNFDCSLDGTAKKAVLVKKENGNNFPTPAGQYVIRLSFKEDKDKNFKHEKQVDFNFFTEDYVELMDEEIEGCGSSDTRNCDVVECKGIRASIDLKEGLAGGSGATNARDAIRSMTNELMDEYDCVGTPEKEAGLYLDTCSPEEVDEFNKKFSRVRLLMEADNLVDDQKIVSEDSYIDHLDILPEAKRNALAKTQFCSRPAYQHLLILGWQPVGTLDRSDEIKAELEKVPRIENLRVELINDEKINLLWNILPEGSHATVENGHFEIKHVYRKWDRTEILTENNDIDVPGRDQRKVREIYSIPDQIIGKHEFEIKFVNEHGRTILEEDFSWGWFNDDYIETYKGGINGCITVGGSGFTSSRGDDPERLKDCDVYEQKIEELGASKRPGDREKVDNILAAIDSAGIGGSNCEYKGSGPNIFGSYSINDCTSEEVDAIWRYYNDPDGGKPDYDCDSGDVCMVKRQVVETLQSLGWEDNRLNQGWEDEI